MKYHVETQIRERLLFRVTNDKIPQSQEFFSARLDVKESISFFAGIVKRKRIYPFSYDRLGFIR